MEKGEDPLKKFVIFNVDRLITRLYKSHLINLSDINQKVLEINRTDKNQKEVAEAISNLYTIYRKKTLDEGNETIREIKQIFDKVNFSLSEEVDINDKSS
tara:strand:- start:165 stop:464 length:300 start_codon:yes stop_codon:yes gene_type:complete